GRALGETLAGQLGDVETGLRDDIATSLAERRLASGLEEPSQRFGIEGPAATDVAELLVDEQAEGVAQLGRKRVVVRRRGARGMLRALGGARRSVAGLRVEQDRHQLGEHAEPVVRSLD